MTSNGRSRKVIEELEAEIAQRERELAVLRQARSVLGNGNGNGHGSTAAAKGHTQEEPKTVAECVERLLMKHSELHLDDIQQKLHDEFHIKITRKNLSNTLNRWISRGAKFKRPRANTFALLGA